MAAAAAVAAVACGAGGMGRTKGVPLAVACGDGVGGSSQCRVDREL